MKSFFKEGQVEAYATEIREKTQKLMDFVGSIAADYRTSDNLPLDNEGRLDPSHYRGLYNDPATDTGRTTEGARRWHGDVADETVVRKDSVQENERLEMLAYAIFWKNLKEKFIVARASRHDGDINKVHTVLLEKETGTLVCAFDEVGETAGIDYEKKLEAIRKQNVEEGGAALKYGLRVETKDNKKAIVPGATKNIPLFYIALPRDRVDKGVKEFIPSPTSQSDFEQKLFAYFTSTILSQVNGLELYSGRMEPALRERLREFKKALEGFKTKESGP